MAQPFPDLPIVELNSIKPNPGEVVVRYAIVEPPSGRAPIRWLLLVKNTDYPIQNPRFLTIEISYQLSQSCCDLLLRWISQVAVSASVSLPWDGQYTTLRCNSGLKV
jgi:hypothetical protein